MQLCEEVADGLASRGHEIAVLTSCRHDGAAIQRPYPVFRVLTIDPDWHSEQPVVWQFFVRRRHRERDAIVRLKHLVESFRPQFIFIWHAAGLSRALFEAAEQLAPTVYYLAGYLPETPEEYVSYWHMKPKSRLKRVLKYPLAKVGLSLLQREGKPVSLRYEHVICVSDYVRKRLVQQGLIPPTSIVIHNGVDVAAFTPSPSSVREHSKPSLACLVAGRIVPDKGVHTVIDAFAALAEYPYRCTLTILGDGPSEYIADLRARVWEYNLEEVVSFEPSVPREEMPSILARHDVLLLPSTYAEPIARSMQEGMSMGLLVIGTTTGGSGEILIHDETGLVFEAGEPQSLATQLLYAARDRAHASQLASAGQQRVRQSFQIAQTVDKVEAYLQYLADAHE